MDFLDFVPVPVFETIGTMAGLTACTVVLVQLIKEWRDKHPSTLAFTYTAGWVLIFVFWCLYGIRFRTMALWLTNGIATILQIGLLCVIFLKRNRSQ